MRCKSIFQGGYYCCVAFAAVCCRYLWGKIMKRARAGATYGGERLGFRKRVRLCWCSECWGMSAAPGECEVLPRWLQGIYITCIESKRH